MFKSIYISKKYIYLIICLFLANSFDSKYIEIEGQKYEYHQNFRLYLVTKETNPKITTSIFSNMIVINCSITQDVSNTI